MVPSHTHGLALLTASGVPQLVEPVLWDYGADLDVHSKSQYGLLTPHSSWCMCLHVCFPVLRDSVTSTIQLGNTGTSLAWLTSMEQKGHAKRPVLAWDPLLAPGHPRFFPALPEVFIPYGLMGMVGVSLC